MALLCSIDGSLLPASEGHIPITDDGLLRGDGAFEMLKLYGKLPFALEDHLDRLDASCKGIFLSYDRPAFEREIQALLDANTEENAYLRLVLTRGERRIAIIEASRTYDHGLKLSSVTYQTTIVLNGLKTLSYAANMTATRIAQNDGADEALLVRPDGSVLEAPTSTVFWADANDTLHTPKLRAGVLASITRDRIMQTVPVVEGSYVIADIMNANEVMLASSLREVQGVSELDGFQYECPGPNTERIAGLLVERIHSELDGGT